MATIKIKNIDLVIDETQTYLISDTAAGVSTLTVKNIQGFTTNQILIIGQLGSENSEIVKTHAVTAPTGNTITLAANTVFPHSASTYITVSICDKVEISNATTISGFKVVIATPSIDVTNDFTIFNNIYSYTGYYFARFYNSITTNFTSYSDPIPTSGYNQFSARTIINKALSNINKKTSEIYSDEFAFDKINDCQMEALREYKRWSFLQVFDSVVGTLYTGQWKFALPTNIDDENTNKSIYNIRIGQSYDLTWVDKEKFNDITAGISHTTLAISFIIGATSITLTDSSDFEDSGTILIGADYIPYLTNDRTTGILTCDATAVGHTLGEDVFQNATLGTPQYWTTYGGDVYVYPLLDPTMNGRDVKMDYYKKADEITSDSTEIVLPDPTVVQYYLTSAFMIRQANGEETTSSQSWFGKYLSRLAKMKQKESLNRTFKLKPTLNSFDMTKTQGDTKKVRTGNFYTGF